MSTLLYLSIHLCVYFFSIDPEKYKKKELLKEIYLQEKQNLLQKKQEIEQELEKESIFKSANEIPDLSDNGKITKEIVDTMVEKIVVSRYGSIEIYLRK